MNLVNSVSLFMEIVLVVFGIPGNVIIIVVSYLYARRSSTDLLIGFQAVIDLLASICAFYSIVMITGPDHVTDTFCKIKAFSLRYVRYTSLFFMAAIALDRFRVVCRPLDQRWSWKSVHIVILVLFCNMLGIAISVPLALVIVPRQFVSGVRCVRSVNQFPFFDLIYAIITTMLFFIALLVTSALYLKVFQVIRKQNRIRATMAAPPLSETVNNAPAEGSSDNGATSHHVQGISTVSGGNSTQEMTEVVQSGVVPRRRPLLLFKGAWRVAPDERREDCIVEMNGLGSANQPPMEDQSSIEQQQHDELLQPKQLKTMNLLTPNDHEGDINHSQMIRLGSPGQNPQDTRLQKKKKKKTTMQAAARKERQTTVMLLVITIIFFVSWLPGIIITHIPSQALRAFRISAFNNLLVIVGYALRNINHIVNVFIYTLMSRRFKQQCTQVIRKLLRRRQH
ncbi:gastrin/cholecystokinin type B receptor-like [Strongylocentrotus purpuratus]|uniref:G-protein coupled receptors family 1 profile domain-containing protein n=1 Tax=Strongylocentrotus purpuratus TaxID=7668 RepID=A0A7M7NY04_STRPU|nr:gastrin/cholecystokinin type B receptor-like [Strongylocentrotus purpuratus]